MKRPILNLNIALLALAYSHVCLADLNGFKLTCEKNVSKPMRDIRVDYRNPSVDTTRSIAELTGMTKGKDVGLNSGWATLGLVTASFSHSIVIPPSSFLVSDEGYACGSFNVQAVLTPSQYSLFVARELPPNSCSFNETFQHEGEHARIYKEGLFAISNDVKRYLDSIPRYYIAQTSTELRKMFLQEQSNISAIIQNGLERVYYQQGLLDSEEEYERLRLGCSGETNQIVQRVLR